MGAHPKMVGVLMAGNGLGKPFGHPLYHPIYRAAAAQSLPIVIHAGGDASPNTLSAATAGGPVATYAEHHLLAAQALMTHIVSLIGQGVFAKYPDLQVLVVAGGLTWIPSLVWRFNMEFNALRRDAPWMKGKPEDYFYKNIRVSTYPFDPAPSHNQMSQLLEADPELQGVLCFASGYPNWDTDRPKAVAEWLPHPWVKSVLYQNALTLFRWSGAEEEGS
jgi:predicted TIM-barrel fold metal-dependent hydrolase